MSFDHQNCALRQFDESIRRATDKSIVQSRVARVTHDEQIKAFSSCLVQHVPQSVAFNGIKTVPARELEAAVVRETLAMLLSILMLHIFDRDGHKLAGALDGKVVESDRSSAYPLMTASRSALNVSACVVGMPCVEIKA